MNYKIAALLIAASGVLGAQSFELPSGITKMGFGIYGTTLSFGYSSLAIPSSSGFITNGTQGIGSDFNSMITTSAGYTRRVGRSNFHLAYTPTFIEQVHYASLNALNQSLSFQYSRMLTSKLTWNFSGNGSDNSVARYLFLSPIFARVTNIPATFEELSDAIVRGVYSNDELASILTGAPVVQTPGQSFIYGNRILHVNLTTGVNYNLTPRTSIHANLSASRSQTRTDGTPAAVIARSSNYLIPRTLTGSANVGMNHQLTPKTTLGLQADVQRTHSILTDSYSVQSSGSIGRTIGQRWFLNVHGGGGYTQPISGLSVRSGLTTSGPRYTYGGTLGFRTQSHSFVGGDSKSFTDVYGLGSQYSDSITGSWHWQKPGRRWAVSSSGSYLRFTGGLFSQFTSRQANSSFSYGLSRQMAVSLSGVYTDNNRNIPSLLSNLTRYGAQITFSWIPSALMGGGVPAGGVPGGAGGISGIGQ